MTTCSVKEAMAAGQRANISAAVLDLGLADGDATVICGQLKMRGVPFVVYSGREPKSVPFVPKPSQSKELIAAVAGLLH